jgi:hypothetical protein
MWRIEHTIATIESCAYVIVIVLNRLGSERIVYHYATLSDGLSSGSRKPREIVLSVRRESSGNRCRNQRRGEGVVFPKAPIGVPLMVAILHALF